MKRKKGSFLITAGIMLIIAAVCLVGYNVYREKTAAALADTIMTELSDAIFKADTEDSENTDGDSEANNKKPDVGSSETEIPDYILNPNMDMPTVIIDSNEYIGILRIPSLELELPVMSGWSYPKLNVAPCKYSGSAYSDNLVIAAHNYICHFASLQYLEEGSDVYFTDAVGNTFHYTMALREILDATAVEDMTDGQFPLTLFTCNNAGYARITIRCIKD